MKKTTAITISMNRTNSAVDGEQRMTSMEIAELTGKQHNDILKAIRKMEPAWEKVTQGKFSLSTYQDTTGRTLPCFSLTKTECLYIATKFNDEARARLVIRWQQLEENRREAMEWERWKARWAQPRQQGLPDKGVSQMIRVWKSRNYVSQITDHSFQKLRFRSDK